MEEQQAEGTIKGGQSLRDAARNKKALRRDIFILSPDQLVIDPENVRDGYESARSRAHIEALKQSMRSGQHMPVLEVQPDAEKDGRYMIVDGAHRKIAADELQAEGIPIKLRCSAFRGNLQDRIAYMMRAAQGLPLDAVEMARGCLKLYNQTNSESEIATAMSKSLGWVSNQLVLATADPVVQQMVKDDLVSATTAINTIREHPNEYVKILSKSVKNLKKQGRKKVTKTAIQGARPSGKTVDLLMAEIRSAYEGLDEATIQEMSSLEGRLKSEELSESDLSETKFSVSAAALIHILKCSDAIRDFEEQCAAREARRRQKMAAAEENADAPDDLPESQSDGDSEPLSEEKILATFGPQPDVQAEAEETGYEDMDEPSIKHTNFTPVPSQTRFEDFAMS